MDSLDDFLDSRLHGRQKPDATAVRPKGGMDAMGEPKPRPVEGMTTAGIGEMFTPAEQAPGPRGSNPPIETTAHAPHKEGPITHLVRALHALMNPTAGAESPQAPDPDDDFVSAVSPDKNQPDEEIREYDRTHPKDHARVAKKLTDAGNWRTTPHPTKP